MVLYLVDDEKNIRESIKTYIPWGEFGVTQVITAKNGMEALEKMQLSTPDVLLSDIRMPKMNGIEFATKVKEFYPDCIILFLSGYADKEYLKSAIQLEAFQYIEKPIDINSLQSILAEAVSKKKRIQQTSEHLIRLEQSHLENRHLIRQNLINLMISTDFNELTRQDKEAQIMLSQLPSRHFTVAYMKINWPKPLEEADLYETKNRFLKITSTENWIDTALIGFNADDDLIILFHGDNAASQITTQLNQLTEQLDILFSYSIGLSQLKTGFHDFKQAYTEAKTSSAYQFYYGTHQMIEYSLTFSTPYELSEAFVSKYKEALKAPERTEVLQIIDKIHSEILVKKPGISYVKAAYTNLFNLLDQEARRTNNAILNFMKNEQIIREIDRTFLLKDMQEFLYQTLASFYDDQVQIGSSNHRIKEIVQYIKKNISNTQLSVNTIAEAFELSQAYLCSYFKKETNYTINQYITNLRIEHSKYLLAYSNEKIYDIAVKVGFCDTNYFSALFKKQVGLTPLEFRKGK